MVLLWLSSYLVTAEIARLEDDKIVIFQLPAAVGQVSATSG
jgi:hypothetical protein